MKRTILSFGTRFSFVNVLPVCIVLLLGCSKSEFERHPISGQITFNGQPVTSGFIVFEPDAKKGNRGPQGYSSIVYGRYETDRDGKGSVLGPVKVRIVSLGSDSTGEDAGVPPFPTYNTSIVIEPDSETFDFEIPAVANPNQQK